MKDCLFCKIIEGNIPADKIYETDDALAFLDINPVNEGHVLVVPKKHFENIFEIPDEILAKIAIEVKHVAKAVQKATNAGGINIAMNNREAAGQVIFHAHIHIIPRYVADGHKLMTGRKYAPGRIEVVAEKIIKEI